MNETQQDTIREVSKLYDRLLNLKEGNQWGIISSSGNWLVFGKKKELEKRVEELNKMNLPKNKTDWEKE